jgi:hypothetical protein
MAMLAQRGTKPTAEEFIHWVIDGEARLGGAAFFQPDKDKFPTITPKRTKIDGRRPVFADIYAALSAEQTKSYLGDFIKTMANLGERAFDIINQ